MELVAEATYVDMGAITCFLFSIIAYLCEKQLWTKANQQHSLAEFNAPMQKKKRLSLANLSSLFHLMGLFRTVRCNSAKNSQCFELSQTVSTDVQNPTSF